MPKRRKRTNFRLDRPFSAAIHARAATIAEQYGVVLRYEDGEFIGRGLELPLTFADGQTADECVAALRSAMTATVAYLLEKGETPPPPASSKKRTEQINIRLTSEEKMLLESASRRGGASGLSEFVREIALEHAAGRCA